MATGIGAGVSPVFDLKPGTPAPTPTCTTDYSLEFDGLTEYGERILGSPVLGISGTGSFTLTVWAKVATLGNQHILSSEGATPPAPQGQWVWRVLPSGNVSFRTLGGTGGAGNISILSPVMSANTWHLLSLVVNMSNATGIGLVDGTAGTTANLSGRDWISVANSIFYLGRAGGGAYFRGNMCHLAIWDKALSSAQLGELYNNNTGKCYNADFSFSGQLQNYYPMFNPTGNFTDPLTDIKNGLDIDLFNMSATNVSTDHPSQL